MVVIATHIAVPAHASQSSSPALGFPAICHYSEPRQGGPHSVSPSRASCADLHISVVLAVGLDGISVDAQADCSDWGWVSGILTSNITR